MAAVTPNIPASLRFDQPSRIKLALIVIAFVAVFWELLDFIPPVGELVHAWSEPDWSHGPLIPLFSAYLVYAHWDDVRRAPLRGAWLGLPVLLLSLALYVWSLSGTLTFGYARPAAMLGALLGVIVLLCGIPVLRYVWLPWAYLLFAIPLPQRVYFGLTNPLRRLAASVASMFLNVIGEPALHVERVGSNLEYLYRGARGAIGVADACSGMRSTVTLCALGVAVAFMSERPLWQRIVLVLACVPIATFCNFIRVTITCALHVFVDPKYATGQYHMMLGMVIILLAFGIFSGLGWLLQHVVVEETETEASEA